MEPKEPTQPEPEKLRLPRQALNADGEPRQVGVEIELGGLDLDVIAARILEVVGGERDLESNSPYETTLRGTRIGDVRVELDALLFREFKLRGFLNRLDLDSLRPNLTETVETAMATEAREFVPFEIVFSPIRIGRIPELDEVAAAFHEHAEGTGASWFNAFGMHLNPELPGSGSPPVTTVLRYLRAFFCLYEDLKKAHAVDFSRSVAPFIDPFPKSYVLRVLDPAYAPDMENCIDDYVEANPTRNRPLDLLPVLAWFDSERVRNKLPDEKINSRPTFHYRLPDCRIDEPGWSISKEWNIWMRVEDLASDETELEKACRQRCEDLRSPLKRLGDWINPS